MGAAGAVFVLFYLGFVVLGLVAMGKVLSKAGYSAWFVLLGLIPLVNLVMFLVFAFSDWPVQQELWRWRQGYGSPTVSGGPSPYGEANPYGGPPGPYGGPPGPYGGPPGPYGGPPGPYGGPANPYGGPANPYGGPAGPYSPPGSFPAAGPYGGAPGVSSGSAAPSGSAGVSGQPVAPDDKGA
jgi:hypothetical protein